MANSTHCRCCAVARGLGRGQRNGGPYQRWVVFEPALREQLRLTPARGRNGLRGRTPRPASSRCSPGSAQGTGTRARGSVRQGSLRLLQRHGHRCPRPPPVLLTSPGVVGTVGVGGAGGRVGVALNERHQVLHVCVGIHPSVLGAWEGVGTRARRAGIGCRLGCQAALQTLADGWVPRGPPPHAQHQANSPP